MALFGKKREKNQHLESTGTSLSKLPVFESLLQLNKLGDSNHVFYKITIDYSGDNYRQNSLSNGDLHHKLLLQLICREKNNPSLGTLFKIYYNLSANELLLPATSLKSSSRRAEISVPRVASLG